MAVLIIFSNPTYLDPLFEDPWGNLVLLYCVGSYGLGIFAMRNASRVRV